MVPVKQRNRHDPDRGVYGDCHRAAVASVLGLELGDVPHFGDGLGMSEADCKEFERRENEFLLSRGLVPLRIAYPGDDLTQLFRCIRATNPGVYYLLGGQSRRGVNHTVVCLGGEVVHDPHADATGLTGPMDDGFYWVTYFGSARVTHSTERNDEKSTAGTVAVVSGPAPTGPEPRL